MSRQLEVVPEDWARAMAVVAHPDDLEYGAGSAIARWTRSGKTVGYVIVTDGEAGIDGLEPGQAGPLRQKEQITSAAIVGVQDVTFLGHRDGVVELCLDLRRDIARQIRRFRPEVLVTATYELTYGMAAGQRIVNQADHRAVGVAVLDAARDAGNRWIFPELLGEGFEPWGGVRHVYVMGASEPTHAVDVTDTVDAGVDSLRAHEAYLEGLGREFDPDAFVRRLTARAGPAIGVRHAVAFGRIQLPGV
ncbi:PIG-L deacetylase family protein [Blastococcus deserti]|uniref:PIG-L deacetylase family protein n=1 Tax=Blastococcus deserti TaxID=2259033 RepID=A0ABW4XEY3_9ACTN